MFFLFNKCPYVIAHMPLNNATEHLVSLRHIAWLFSTQVYFYELSGNIMERMLHQDRYTDTEIYQYNRKMIVKSFTKRLYFTDV